MNYLALSCLVIVTAYTFITRKVLGYIPESISASWYAFARKGYSEGFAWAIMSMGLLVITMPLVYTYSHQSSILLMCAGFFLFCVAIAAPYKLYPFWHYFFTYTSIASGFAVTISEHWPSLRAFVPLITAAVIIVILKLCKVKSLTWWTEIVLIFAILGSLV